MLPFNYIVWGIESGIYPTPPVRPFRCRRQFKLKWFPVSVQNEMEGEMFFLDLDSKSQAV
jgi:hypothetical protein